MSDFHNATLIKIYHILFYTWKSYLKPFRRGGAVKLWEEKDDLINELINYEVFVEQPLASPGSAKLRVLTVCP